MEQNNRDRLVELASHMFVTEGVKAVRMDDVAHRAGISKRTLYEMFGDKEGLLYESMRMHFKRFEEQSINIGTEAPNIIIEMLLSTENVVRNSETNWRILNALRRFHPALYTRLHTERAQDRYAEFKNKLNRGVKQGIVDPRVNVDLAMAMIYHTATNIVFVDNIEALPKGVTPQEALVELMIYFLRGISTTKGMDIIDEYIAEKQNNINK